MLSILAWIIRIQAKRADFSFASNYEIEHADVEKVRARFKLVDETVQRFLDEYTDRWLDNIANEVKWQKNLGVQRRYGF